MFPFTPISIYNACFGKVVLIDIPIESSHRIHDTPCPESIALMTRAPILTNPSQASCDARRFLQNKWLGLHVGKPCAFHLLHAYSVCEHQNLPVLVVKRDFAVDVPSIDSPMDYTAHCNPHALAAIKRVRCICLNGNGPNIHRSAVCFL